MNDFIAVSTDESRCTHAAIIDSTRPTSRYNSWDRQPYFTNNGVDDGFTPAQKLGSSGSIIKDWDQIKQNFWINGYNVGQIETGYNANLKLTVNVFAGCVDVGPR